jgi:hypothetical protein
MCGRQTKILLAGYIRRMKKVNIADHYYAISSNALYSNESSKQRSSLQKVAKDKPQKPQ